MFDIQHNAKQPTGFTFEPLSEKKVVLMSVVTPRECYTVQETLSNSLTLHFVDGDDKMYWMAIRNSGFVSYLKETTKGYVYVNCLDIVKHFDSVATHSMLELIWQMEENTDAFGVGFSMDRAHLLDHIREMCECNCVI